MEQTVKQRLITFIRYKGLSQAKFEKSIGASNGFVNNISKGIGAEKLQRILNEFPELNSAWLLYGEGEMLKEDQFANPAVRKTADLLDKLIASMEATIESQKQVIETQRAEIERLQRALLEREAK